VTEPVLQPIGHRLQSVGDELLVEQALTQIKKKNYAGAYQNPVVLGIVFNDTARSVSWWRREGGTASNL
jgi:hypothetical protein